MVYGWYGARHACAAPRLQYSIVPPHIQVHLRAHTQHQYKYKHIHNHDREQTANFITTWTDQIFFVIIIVPHNTTTLPDYCLVMRSWGVPRTRGNYHLLIWLSSLLSLLSLLLGEFRTDMDSSFSGRGFSYHREDPGSRYNTANRCTFHFTTFHRSS